MFVGWEGVGLCSYLLIGFWYREAERGGCRQEGVHRQPHRRLGFLLGLFLVFFTFGTLDFREVAAAVTTMPRRRPRAFGMLSAICLLLFIGAVGKSAQIPLFVWLPDAMEGPTPVSALIHAATMVTAGVYIIARNAVLFEHAPLVLTFDRDRRRRDRARRCRDWRRPDTTSSGCWRTRRFRSWATCSLRSVSARSGRRCSTSRPMHCSRRCSFSAAVR